MQAWPISFSVPTHTALEIKTRSKLVHIESSTDLGLVGVIKKNDPLFIWDQELYGPYGLEAARVYLVAMWRKPIWESIQLWARSSRRWGERERQILLMLLKLDYHMCLCWKNFSLSSYMSFTLSLPQQSQHLRYHMCGSFPHPAVLCDTSWVSYTLTEVWQYLTGESTRSHRLRAKSHQTVPGFRWHLQVLGPHITHNFNLTQLQIRVSHDSHFRFK